MTVWKSKQSDVWSKLRGDEDFREMDSKKVRRLMNIIVAEILGTAILVGVGCGSTIKGIPTDDHVSHLIIALTFGFAIAIVVTTFGHISGCHVNPAVSLVSLMHGFISLPVFCVYVASQIVGGILGMLALRLITPGNCFDDNLCVTLPHKDVGPVSAMFAEFFMSAILCLTVCAAWDRRSQDRHDSMPIKFGLTVAALALAGAKFSGASINPARSFGPALVTGHWENHWVYWVGPMLGGFVATLVYRVTLEEPRLPPPTRSDEEEAHPLS